MRSVVLLAALGIGLAGCAGYGVEDWGDSAKEAQPFRIAPGEKATVRTTPGTNRQVWSVLLLLDAPGGAVIEFGETAERSDLITTGSSPNYVRVRAPGGAAVRVENPKSGSDVNATFLVEWREFVD